VLVAQAGLEGEEIIAIFWPNTGSNIEVAKPKIFNRAVSKISMFLIVCMLYIKIRIRDTVVGEQV